MGRIPRSAALLAALSLLQCPVPLLAERTEDFLGAAGHLEAGDFYHELQENLLNVAREGQPGGWEETTGSQRHEKVVTSEDPCEYEVIWTDWFCPEPNTCQTVCRRKVDHIRVLDMSKLDECEKCWPCKSPKDCYKGYECGGFEREQEKYMCDMQELRACSKVDINNRLKQPGVIRPVGCKKFAKDEKECVLQLWEVEETDERWYFRLLAETFPGDNTAFFPLEKAGLDKRSLIPAEALERMKKTLQARADLEDKLMSGKADLLREMLERLQEGSVLFNAEFDEIPVSSVALGFRNCFIQRESLHSRVATICNWGDKAFQVPRDSEAWTSDMEKRSMKYSLYDRGDDRGFALYGGTVQFAPDAAVIESSEAEGYSIKLHLPRDRRERPRDYGSSIFYNVLVQKRFNRALDGGNKCPFKQVPLCKDKPKDPCMEMLKFDLGQDEVVKLNNFPMDGRYDVQVYAQNAVKEAPGYPWTTIWQTKRGSNCEVNYWTCAGDESIDVNPEGNVKACDLDTPPLPVCVMNLRKTLGILEKCNNKKYIRECTPVMIKGDPSCAGTKKYTVCEHRSSAADCKAEGCGWKLIGNPKVCCCVDEQKANCACTKTDTKDTCPAEGLFKAGNPAKSCKH